MQKAQTNSALGGEKQMHYKTFGSLASDARETDEYWFEGAKLDFAVDVHDLMEHRKVTRSQLAAKLKKSPSYVTKVLRGDTNVTIETMVRIVRAIGGKLHIRVNDSSRNLKWLEVIDSKSVQLSWPSRINQDLSNFAPAQVKSDAHSQPLAA